MQELRLILQKIPRFTNRIFRLADDRWKDHSEWPTVQEMRDADQRVVILSDNNLVQSKELGIMLREDIVMENHWKGLDKCISRNKQSGGPWETRHVTGRTWSRLFTFNHFCCATGIESLQRVDPKHLGGGDNGWGILYPRVLECTEANGRGKKPNFIAIDWAHVGDAHEVADYLNFGGRLGMGQRCATGQDCATGACSKMKRCHCAICESACSGCRVDEACVAIRAGVHGCESVSGVITANSSNAVKFQGTGFIIFQLILLRIIWR